MTIIIFCQNIIFLCFFIFLTMPPEEDEEYNDTNQTNEEMSQLTMNGTRNSNSLDTRQINYNNPTRNMNSTDLDEEEMNEEVVQNVVVEQQNGIDRSEASYMKEVGLMSCEVFNTTHLTMKMLKL